MLLHALFAAVFVAAAPAPSRAQTMPPPPTKTAIAAPVDLSRNSFELTTIMTHQYNPPWTGWTFVPLSVVGGITTGSGIAINGTNLLGGSNPTTYGSYNAFLHGLGTITTNVILQPGLWRVRFLGEERIQHSIADGQVVRVLFDGDNVFEQQLTGSYTEYATEPIVVTAAGSKQIQFVGLTGSGTQNMALIDRVRIDPVLPWNDPNTWGGIPPGNGDDVLVPPLTAVSMNGACLAGTVQVQGQLLADEVDGSLATRWVLVMGSGSSFRVGTEAAPFQHQFTLTLNSQNQSENIGMMTGAGTKFLMAMDEGRIDMHGQPQVSWTRLASVNGSTITVSDVVGWHPGDEIVVTASQWMPQDANPYQTPLSEVRSITSIAGGSTMVLSAPLNNFHCTAGSSYTSAALGRTWTLDERAEVGLLTHNVRIEGDAPYSSTNQFGAHVMLMRDSYGSAAGFGRFENVQLTRMGQKKKLGRYPMHWHMQMANGQGQYMRGCSVRESYNRACTIHGSDYVTVEDNVFFDHVGHGMFLEDGGEQNNHIRRNLVIMTRKPAPGDELLHHDNSHDEPQNRSPAAFWITNPNNEFTGNVACESVGTGYWFALHHSPYALSAQQGTYALYFHDIVPTALPLLAFDDNVCHGCKSAIDLNDSVDAGTDLTSPQASLDDTLETNIGWVPQQAVTIHRFKAYGCATTLYAGGGSDKVTFDDCVLADSAWHVQFACKFTCANSLLVEQSGSGVFTPNPTDSAFCGHAYVTYDGPGVMTGNYLVGFDGSGHQYATVVSSVFGAADRHTNHLFSNLAFSGQPRIWFLDFASAIPGPGLSLADPRHWGIAVRDVDGTLSGHAGYTLIPNHPMMHLTDSLQNTPDFYITNPSWSQAWMSPYLWGHLLVYEYQANGAQLLPNELHTMVFTRDAHNGYLPATFTSNFDVDAYRQLPVLSRPAAQSSASECWYALSWSPTQANTPVSKKMRLTMEDLSAGDVMDIHLVNQDGWSGEQVSIVRGPVLTPVNLNQLSSQSSTAYARTGTQDLWLRMVHPGTSHQVQITWQ